MSLHCMAIQEVRFMLGKHQPCPAIRHLMSEQHNDREAPSDHRIDRCTANCDILIRAGGQQVGARHRACRLAIFFHGCPSKPVLWRLHRMIYANHVELDSPIAFRFVFRNLLHGSSDLFCPVSST